MAASCCAQLFDVNISCECFNLFGHNHDNPTAFFLVSVFPKGLGIFKHCHVINMYLVSIKNVFNIL